MSETYNKAPGGMPSWMSVLILSLSFLLITWYFIAWPILLHRKGFFIKKDGIVSRLQYNDA